jgi:putative transposase
MSEEYRKGSHTVYDIQYHIVWVTKYRYHILKGEIGVRARDLIRQTCEARNITILTGHISKDHVHIHVSCPPEMAPSKIAQYVKGRSSRLLQQEFPHLGKRYWGKHLWARGYFCATVGKLTEKMIEAYIEQQEKARPKDVFTVADEHSASAEPTDFQS